MTLPFYIVPNRDEIAFYDEILGRETERTNGKHASEFERRRLEKASLVAGRRLSPKELATRPIQKRRRKSPGGRPKRPVICNETGKVYECMNDAVRAFGLKSAGHIGDAIKHQRKIGGKYTFQFVPQSESPCQ